MSDNKATIEAEFLDLQTTSHIRLKPRRDGGQVIDTCRSILNTRQPTIHLGAAEGIPLALRPTEPIAPVPGTESQPDGQVGPDIVRATGRAVAPGDATRHHPTPPGQGPKS